MFSKPTHCCCCFSLRTGSLILATWLAIVSIYDACIKTETLSGGSVAAKTISMLIPILLAILCIMFLYGTIKRKAKLVHMFSVFIIINTIIKIILAIFVIVHIITNKNEICANKSGIKCSLHVALNMMFELLPDVITWIFSFHFYYVVKAYANSLQNETNHGSA